MQCLQLAIKEFGLQGKITPLVGGSQQVFRIEDTVLKRVTNTSFEHNDTDAVVKWLCAILNKIVSHGFRHQFMKKTTSGSYVATGGWTAWNFLEGEHAKNNDVRNCIDAIKSYHIALADVPFDDVLITNLSPWGVAQQAAWSDPIIAQPKLRPLLDELYRLRKPLDGLQWQVIHGDLNPENIIITSNESPAIIDFSPFWAPSEFALAIYANFIGPRCGDIEILENFKSVNNFDQLLIRAGIRMLVVMSVINQLDNWDISSEKRAAELIIEYIVKQKYATNKNFKRN